MKKNIFKKICFVSLSLILFLLASCSKKNDSNQNLLQQVKNKGSLTFATEGTWAPWTYHDQNDNLVGFDIEVAQNIAKKIGVKADFVEVEWDGIFAGIDSKRYDLAANGVEITEERAQKYDFSEPYCYICTAIIVRADNNSINSFEDLKGKTTANTLASTYASLAESYGAKAIAVDDLNQTLQLVLEGRVDATLNADISFYDYIKVHPEANLKIVARTPQASQVALPLRKEESTKTLMTEINKAIKELKEDGTLKEISVKYFGQDFSQKQ